MRNFVAALPLAISLCSCTGYQDPYYGEPPSPPYPQDVPPLPPGPPVGEGVNASIYRAIGTEPFWDLEIGNNLVFTDRGNDVAVTQPRPVPINGVAGEIYRTPRIEVNIVHANCSDGMSDRTYPDRVQVRVDGRQYEGCGAPIAFFLTTDERGNSVPPPGAAPPPMGFGGPPLDGTRWRVTAINGRPTPRTGNFGMEFTRGRLSATFGCNGLGANYTQTSTKLDAGPVVGTEMACPDMSWETDGARVLEPVMTVRTFNPNRIVLESSGGSIELVRR